MAATTAQRDRPKASNGQGTWFHLPNGNIRVEITVRDASGKAIRKTKTVKGGSGEMGRKNEALKALLAEYPDRKLPEPDEPEPTVAACLDEWCLHYLHDVAKSTQDNYRTQVNKHIKPALGEIPLSELSTAKVNTWLRKMASNGASRNSIRLAKKVLAMGLEHARSEGSIAVNVARDAKIPDAPTRKTRSLTEAEIKRFLEAAKGDRYEAAFIVHLGLGLRIGEVLALSWADKDGDVLHVRHSQRREGGSLIPRGALKTEASQRTLGLPKAVSDALWTENERIVNDEESSDHYANPLDLIFTDPHGGPVRPETYRRHLMDVYEKAGITGATSHSLRHSCATLLVEAGIPLGVVSDMLGHADMSMLVERYRHATNSTISGHVIAMDVVLAS